MTTLSARALDWRARLPLRPGDPDCTHPRGYYRETAAGWIRRECRRCGLPLGPVEPRCSELIDDRSRRCLAPGRVVGLCRTHAQRP